MADMDLAGFAKALRKGSRELNKNLSSELRQAGEVVAMRGRELAGSDRIAGSIHVVRKGYNVAITAGGKDAPEAALREAGNPGASPTKSTFKHPVFGNRSVWVEQAKHPFLMPAFLASREKVLNLMKKAMHDSFPGNESEL